MVPSKSGTYKIYTDFDEASEPANPDSDGRVIFNGLKFDEDTKSSYTGNSGKIEVAQLLNDGDTPDYPFDDETKYLGKAYTISIPVIQPCK
jgi:hypothetical protein